MIDWLKCFGPCGRLFPRIGKVVRTPWGVGKLVAVGREHAMVALNTKPDKVVSMPIGSVKAGLPGDTVYQPPEFKGRGKKKRILPPKAF